MTRDEIIARNPLLDYLQSTGRTCQRDGPNWKCLCMFHDEKTPSFTVYDDNHFHCYGCGRTGSVIDVYMVDRGVDVREAMRELSGQPRDHGGLGEELAVYPYTDENGILLFEVVRFHPKTFRQRRVDDLGDRHWKMGDCRRVIYRLPAVIAATTVFIVEGEKDVHTLEAIGRVATCNPGGAGKWKLVDACNACFEGKHVIIIPDCDDTGRRHAEDIGTRLVDLARTVSIVDLPDGNKDVSDLAAHTGARFAEEFARLEKTAHEFIAHGDNGERPQDAQREPPPDEREQKKSEAHAGQYYSLLERLAEAARKRKVVFGRIIDELREFFPHVRRDLPEIKDAETACENLPPEPPQLIAGLLHQGAKMSLNGGSKSFKTWALIELATCIAGGLPWFDRFSTHPCRVLYINFELPEWSSLKRVKIISTALGLETAPSNLKIWDLRGFSDDATVLIERIKERVVGQSFALIVIDPIYKLLGGRDENSARDMAELMRQVEHLMMETGAAVVFAAHFSKGSQSSKEAIDRASGSGVIARDPDSIVVLTKHEQDDCFSVEMILRDFPPQAPFVVRREHPVMHVDEGLDPADLKQPRGAAGGKAAGRPKEHTADDLMKALRKGGMTTADWMSSSGMKRSTFYELREELENAARVGSSLSDGKWFDFFEADRINAHLRRSVLEVLEDNMSTYAWQKVSREEKGIKESAFRSILQALLKDDQIEQQPDKTWSKKHHP